MDHLTVHNLGKGQAATCLSSPDEPSRKRMSYKSRQKKRAIRRHLKQERAAEKRIARFFTSIGEPRAVGLAVPII
jgi:hypothetical protein